MRDPNGAADRSDVAVEFRGAARDLRRAVIVEEKICAPVGLARLALQYAVQRVGAGLEGCVEDAATGSAHFGVVGVLLDLDLVHGFNRRNDYGAVAEVGDGNVVDLVVVAADRAAGKRDCARSRTDPENARSVDRRPG